MKPTNQRILTINGGSSSIKFALFEAGESLRRILAGELERIGRPEATLRPALQRRRRSTGSFPNPMAAMNPPRNEQFCTDAEISILLAGRASRPHSQPQRT